MCPVAFFQVSGNDMFVNEAIQNVRKVCEVIIDEMPHSIAGTMCVNNCYDKGRFAIILYTYMYSLTLMDYRDKFLDSVHSSGNVIS